jgi:hypothetical protein
MVSCLRLSGLTSRMASRRILMITCLAVLVTSGGIVQAGPASAAASPSSMNIDCTNGAASAYDQTFTGVVGDTFTFTNTNGSFACVVDSYAGVVTASGLNSSDEFQSAPVTFTIVASGSFRVNYNAGRANSSTITVVAESAPTQASSSPLAPQTFDLSITPTDGTSCSTTSPSGNSGTWINLPGVNDCTMPPTKPGTTLLGWATNANFPVEIAQRQVDNGWGAYETFNADGQLTGVFIPAGGATFLSAAGKLYPIWSD